MEKNEWEKFVKFFEKIKKIFRLIKWSFIEKKKNEIFLLWLNIFLNRKKFFRTFFF